MKTITTTLLASAACAALMAGCATNGQGQLVFDPNQLNVALTAGQPAVVEEVYQPVPTDVYVANVAERDVFISGGDTYIWVTGPNGVRHRQFYAHGDHRADVFHRREELHRVMANHGGHLPDHAIGGEHRAGGDHQVAGDHRVGGDRQMAGDHRMDGHPQMGHPGEPAPAVAGHGQQPRPGGMPGAAPGGMPAAHAAAPARPAPPQKSESKDKKKS